MQTGPERHFASPPLAAGRRYAYVMTASWTEKGRPRSESRTIEVVAGTRSLVDFSVADTRPAAPAGETSEPKTRTFDFVYAATVTGLAPGKTARIWLPLPPKNDAQEVLSKSFELPVKGTVASEPKYGNEMIYVEAPANADGKLSLQMTFRIQRKEVLGKERKPVTDARRVALYLQPDKLVPIDGKPLELIKGKQVPADQTAAAHLFYDLVDNHMKYSKEGTGWGRGDSAWACDSKYGNCTDFHSLFISLARSQKIPAKFEIGFPLPEKRGAGEVKGYHCWAFFKPEGKGWLPVDISEANKNPSLKDYYFGNLTEDRITFTTGRDIDLVPKQDGPPLNYFVYPYVEVDGKPYSAEKVEKKFTFTDAK
jgi:uncharacterized protein (TIGR03000 family)